MEMRCCTPPAPGGGEEMFSSCRHLFFMNEEDDDHDDGAALLDKSITMRPSESLSRPSGTRTSGESRPSDDLPNSFRLPSPTRAQRSPRRAFQPIQLNIPAERCSGRASIHGWSMDGVSSSTGNSSTPWRPSTSLDYAAPSHTTTVGMGGGGGGMYLQTPEVQRVNTATRASNAMAHLLYTPQIPQVCLAWRANLDAELDPVNALHPPDQLPAVTTLIDNMLYMGGFPNAQTVQLLSQHGIRHVINCCAQDAPTSPEAAATFTTYDLHCFDQEDYLILHHDYERFATVVSQLLAQGEKVFVHCIAGVNRSATLCAAYLMDRLALTPVEAVRVFRHNGRMRVLDNRGFRHQLVDHHLQGVEAHKAEQGLY